MVSEESPSQIEKEESASNISRFPEEVKKGILKKKNEEFTEEQKEAVAEETEYNKERMLILAAKHMRIG